MVKSVATSAQRTIEGGNDHLVITERGMRRDFGNIFVGGRFADAALAPSPWPRVVINMGPSTGLRC